jgi:hypothetical protein
VIGVFTERGHHLNDRHFQGVGWSMKDIPIQIQGMKPDAVFPATYIGGKLELDTEVLRAEMLEMTREFMRTCADPGAILFECTNMCPFAAAVAAESGLPVFDVNTLMNWFARGAEPPNYI